jgi:hypothetical protein
MIICAQRAQIDGKADFSISATPREVEDLPDLWPGVFVLGGDSTCDMRRKFGGVSARFRDFFSRF